MTQTNIFCPWNNCDISCRIHLGFWSFVYGNNSLNNHSIGMPCPLRHFILLCWQLPQSHFPSSSYLKNKCLIKSRRCHCTKGNRALPCSLLCESGLTLLMYVKANIYCYSVSLQPSTQIMGQKGTHLSVRDLHLWIWVFPCLCASVWGGLWEWEIISMC